MRAQTFAVILSHQKGNLKRSAWIVCRECIVMAWFERRMAKSIGMDGHWWQGMDFRVRRAGTSDGDGLRKEAVSNFTAICYSFWHFDDGSPCSAPMPR